MKRNWQPEELIEHWTLLPDELALLVNKTNPNRLGFALLLKFFQLEGRFPHYQHEVPQVVVLQVALQLGLIAELYLKYDWNGRTIKRHRAQIRNFFGFREATAKDSQDIARWLIGQVLRHEHDLEHLLVEVYQQFRQRQIEPPTPERVERLIHSAIHYLRTALLCYHYAAAIGFNKSEVGQPIKQRQRVDQFSSRGASLLSGNQSRPRANWSRKHSQGDN